MHFNTICLLHGNVCAVCKTRTGLLVVENRILEIECHVRRRLDISQHCRQVESVHSSSYPCLFNNQLYRFFKGTRLASSATISGYAYVVHVPLHLCAFRRGKTTDASQVSALFWFKVYGTVPSAGIYDWHAIYQDV